jgi:hypothetical protein
MATKTEDRKTGPEVPGTGNPTPEGKPGDGNQGSDKGTPDGTGGGGGATTGDGTGAAGTGEAKKRTRSKAPDTTGISAEAIQAATLALPDLIAASAPVRERSDEQKEMDKVAVRAYREWIKAKRPSLWQKMPVITYFLDEADLPKYRYLIRRACNIVEGAEGSPGVRARFGNEFTLSEEMARKIARPELAGKTVLAWAAVDKRANDDEKTKTETKTNA